MTRHKRSAISALSATWLMVLTASGCLAFDRQAMADELQATGILGNSGGRGSTAVTFAGEVAPGMGPVIDAQQGIWERGGADQLNRYAPDGRLLARFEIPASTDRNDQLTRVGDLLVMKIRGALYTLPIAAAADTKVERIRGDVDALSSNSYQGQVVLFDKQQNKLHWFDPKTGAATPLVEPPVRPMAIHIDAQATVYAFGGGGVHAWRGGEAVAGFPRDFHGERPQKIGKFWYSHGWHGTIHRMNERFEPAPGVVLGGASGSFIGYLPQSVDVTNGRGLAHLRDNIFVVSGLDGVVQLLTWDGDELRFRVARRIGALAGLTGVALDAQGNIWTPRGGWRWDDGSAAPLSLGDREPEVHAQPVVLSGRTLCVLKQHYGYVQLATGPALDSHGWSHLESRGIRDFDLPDDLTGAAVVPGPKGQALIVARRSGGAFQIPVSDDGQSRGRPANVEIAGLVGCTSLAWHNGRLFAGIADGVVAFTRNEQGQWQAAGRVATSAGPAYVHSDGQTVALVDTAAGIVRVLAEDDKERARFTGLHAPTHVALAGNRLVVYESGRQRLLKLTRAGESVAKQVPLKAVPTLTARPAKLGEPDFHDLTRPGGIPLAIALHAGEQGLTIALRTRPTPKVEVKLGCANNAEAFLLTTSDAVQSEPGRYNFLLPPGDWTKLRLAAQVICPGQRERFGHRDHRAMHAPFSENPADWAPFDWHNYRETVAERRQEIRLTFDQPADGKTTLVIEDAAGRRIRNLVSARSFAPGRHTVVWDGLNENGQLVAPGDYTWRGITHPGIEPVYRMNFANGGESSVAPWGPNHSTLHAAAANAHYVFFAAPVTEGGWALVALNSRGEFVQGYDHLHGYGIGHDAIAADQQYLYCAQDGFTWGGTKDVDLESDDWTADWKLTIVRYDIETGKLVEFPGKRRAIEVDTMQVGPGSKHPDLKQFNLAGLAFHDGKLWVGSRNRQSVLVLDAATGKELQAISLPGIRHLAAGREVFAATDQHVVRLPGKQVVANLDEVEPAGLAVGSNGQLWVSDRRTHQVLQFSSAGKIVARLGTPGGPYKGAYDPQRMVRPAGLVVGPQGKLWVTEERWNPKRVLAWDMDKKTVVYEKFGMPHYGGDGSGFDPENPRRWIGLGCFWDVDIDRGTARPTHILSLEEGHFGNYEPHSYVFFREAGRTFVCARGKISLISEVLPDGTLHDLVATADAAHFAYGCGWDPPQAYIDAYYAKWPETRAKEKPGRKGQGKPWAQRGTAVLWVDSNGDGTAQQQEFELYGRDLNYGGAAWGHLQTSLALDMPVVVDDQVKIVTLRRKRFRSNGVPDYPTLADAIAAARPIDLTPGYKRSGVPTVRDSFGRFIFNSDPEMNAYAKGEHRWSYPNQWSNVHGSHKAPLPEPGVMQGTLGILGIAPLDKVGNVFFLNGNHGRCFLLSSDGLYLDEAFVDVRVSYLKNAYRLGGEIFGGSFGQSRSDGKYYVQIGHGPYRIYELKGLSAVQRLAGSLRVTKAQVLAAQQRQLRQIASEHQVRRARIPGQVTWDKSGKFRVEVDARIADDRLHLHYRVQDPSPWVNNGRDWTKLFATGDTVDFQLGADALAPANRRQPVPGDKRLLVAPLEGKPIAVLYEYRKPDGTRPIEFTSPWRGEKVDHVARLDDAEIDVKTSRGGYEVRLAVPLARLDIASPAGKTLRADFGVTYGDAEGTDTNLRSYWSNQSTGLVDDIPGEIMLAPHLWGEVTFE